MTQTINAGALESLVRRTRDDADIFGLVMGAFDAFENYHAKVVAHQVALRVYGPGDAIKIIDADRERTLAHNLMLSKVAQLNRLAEQRGIAPVYAGTVSQDQPYRREVADAVFAYLQAMIEHRIG
jgi:hypothetical protein